MTTRRGILSWFDISRYLRDPRVRDVQLNENGDFVDVQQNKVIGDPLRIDDKKTRGKLVIVNFFSIDNESRLPVMTNLAEIARLFGKKMGRDIFINSVTLDPDEDTAERLEGFADRLKAPDGWTFVRVNTDAARVLVGRMNRVRGYTSGREVFYGTPNGFWGTFPVNNTPEEVVHRLNNSMPGFKSRKLKRAGPAVRGKEKYPWTAREA